MIWNIAFGIILGFIILFLLPPVIMVAVAVIMVIFNEISDFIKEHGKK